MACGKCGSKTKCGCSNGGSSGNCANGSGSSSSQISQINTTLTGILSAIAPFMNGHPILQLFTPSDIACFNTTTGLGSNTWVGWGLCNGTGYLNATTNLNTQSPNLIDKFIVGAGGTYAVGATGGATTVSLVSGQNGPHTHILIDQGHFHTVTDLEHTHGTSQAPHTHAGNSVTIPPLLGTTDTQGEHYHGIFDSHPVQVGGSGNSIISGGLRSTEAGGAALGGPLSCTPSDPLNNDAFLIPAGAHTHTVTVNSFSVSTSVQSASISITVQNAFTGISRTDSAATSATAAISGNGDPHENLPPFFSLIYVIKI